MSKIIATDLKFYPPSPGSGVLDLSLPELTKINAQLFPKVKIDAKVKNVVYRKIWIFNFNTTNELKNPVLEIIENPHNFFSIAPTQPQAPLPTDADDMNVQGGDGPGQFTINPINLPNLKVNDGFSFWIRRFIYWTGNEDLYINFEVKLSGGTNDA